MNRTPDPEKKPTFKWHVIKRLIPYLLEHKLTLTSALLLMLLSSALTLAVSFAQ